MTSRNNIVKPTLRVCAQGHRFYKSSDCPTCPVCEANRKPTTGFLSLLSAPARRALTRESISTLEKLAGYSETEIRAMHGIGPSTIPILEKALAEKGLRFQSA